jgi:hypothetical protein
LNRIDGLLGTSIDAILFATAVLKIKIALQGGAYEKQGGIHTTFYQGIELQDFVPMSDI